MLFLSNVISAQSSYSIDSSYTIKSTYTKLIKKYPFIKIAEAEKNIKATQISDVVYSKDKGRSLHLDAFFNRTKKKSCHNHDTWRRVEIRE